MSQIQIQIAPSDLKDDWVVTRLQRLLDSEGRTPPKTETRQAQVPTDGRLEIVEVTPGLWAAEIALPSGELVGRQIKVGEGESPTLRFELPPIPGQQSKSAPAGLGGPPRPIDTSAPLVMSDSFSFALRDRSPPLLTWKIFRAPKPDLPFAYWRGLADCLRLERSLETWAQAEADPHEGFAPVDRQENRETWRSTVIWEDHVRRFARVSTQQAIELVSLPEPWTFMPDEGVELTLEQEAGTRDVRASFSVRDPHYGPLLAYLDAGARSIASTAAKSGPARDNMLLTALRGKAAQPLAACAAGYALLGSLERGAAPLWAPWLRNLSRNFPSIPDGPILNARWLAFSGEGQDSEIRSEALTAFARGAPHFSQGLTWLLEALWRFDDDPKCVEAARLVRQVAVRSQAGSLFTVLNLKAPRRAADTGD